MRHCCVQRISCRLGTCLEGSVNDTALFVPHIVTDFTSTLELGRTPTKPTMVVAAERLASYMAQIDAAMDAMKEKKAVAKMQAKGSSATGSKTSVGGGGDTEGRDQGPSLDEVEQLRCTSLEDLLEYKEVREALDTDGVRPLPRKLLIDPMDEVIVKRLSEDSQYDKMEVDKVPSMVEFPTYFEDEETAKGRNIDSVLKRLQMFCLDIYWGQTWSVLDHMRPPQIIHSSSL